MRVWMTAGILLTSLVATTAYVYAGVPGSRKIGTHPCLSCVLGYPRVDPGTANELSLAVSRFNRLVSIQPLWIVPGDVLTMCNEAACVDYEVTVGGEGYIGVKYETQTSTLPPTGGNGTGTGTGTGSGSGYGDGQGVGNSGGANPGSGCYGSCGGGRTGTVTVGQSKPTHPPTREN